MTDAEYSKQCNRVVVLMEYWLPRLGLDRWTLKITCQREGIEPDADGWVSTAYCEARWQYKKATISLNLSQFVDESDVFLEEHFLHECCHALVAEMRMWAGAEEIDGPENRRRIKHEEVVVEALTMAFLNTRYGGLGSPPIRAPRVRLIREDAGLSPLSGD